MTPFRYVEGFTASLWVHSSLAQGELKTRIVFPNLKDPRSGKPLSIRIAGEHNKSKKPWKKLTCTISERKLSARIRELRKLLNLPDADFRNPKITSVVFEVALPVGTREFSFDELECNPAVPVTSSRLQVFPSSAEQNAQTTSGVEFRLDRLSVHDRPFFPRMIAYHGESPQTLKDLGMNVVWVPDLTRPHFFRELENRGIWVVARPSQSALNSANHNSSDWLFGSGHRSLPANLLAWYGGTKIPTKDKKKFIEWVSTIKRLDRFDNRPMMADVTGDARVFSRYVSMLGVSRPVLNTSFSLREYRDWLKERRRIARPGSFLWTWVQTEAISHTAVRRQQAGHTPVFIEPEQIRLQVYIALSAGCKGIGFWKTDSFEENSLQSKERNSIIEILNLELKLLEPLLATGDLQSSAPFSLQGQFTQKIGQRRLDFRTNSREKEQRTALLKARQDRYRNKKQLPGELQAAMIRTDYGMLLLPVWYRTDAQFVPDQMAGSNASITVHGVSESASAWQITTTGIHNLKRVRVTGGIQITIPKFEQTAAILLTSDRKFVRRLQRKVLQTAEKSARAYLRLAKLKFRRVQKVDRELRKLGSIQPDAPHILAKAYRHLQIAESSQNRSDFSETRENCINVMQLLRILQRAHWRDAVRKLSSPLTSPHTLCFQTLPDHWRMLAKLGRSKQNIEKNILETGDFEDINAMVEEGWKHLQGNNSNVRATAELHPTSRQGKYSLRMVAIPRTGVDPPEFLTVVPVSVKTPNVAVEKGQIVYISGWIRVTSTVIGNQDGVMLFDNLGGVESALRWKYPAGWQYFELIREIPKDDELNLTMRLTGIGEVQFDDLRIRPQKPLSLSDRTNPEPKSESNRFNFLNRLPKFRSRTNRK